MKFLADENFPRPALAPLRNAGSEVFSVAEECPGISDEEVAALCSESHQVLLTFDNDFGELAFHRGLSAGTRHSVTRCDRERRYPRWPHDDEEQDEVRPTDRGYRAHERCAR